MNFKKMLENEQIKPYLLKARYGVEKEGQRVDLTGKLAATTHPKTILMSNEHPYIKRDFSETQLELVTPVTDSLEELFDYLSAIHEVTYRSMDKDEMIWPLSMPPGLPADEKDIVLAKLADPEGVRYRELLAQEHGRRKQMISGIHYNFEFGEELIQKLFKAQSEITKYHQFKTKIYMKITRNYLHYRWLITYLYGATPSSEKNFFEDKSLDQPVRSIRSSKYGYVNCKDIQVSYSSLEKYISDISTMVEQGRLLEEKEFYADVRLRGGNKVSDLEERGIRYIELRNIDINPFEQNGISYQQAEFLHIFLIYMLWIDESEQHDDWVTEGEKRSEKVALEHPLAITEFKAEAEAMLNEIEHMVENFELSVSENLFDTLREMVTDPSKTLAGRLFKQSEQSNQSQVATRLGKAYYDEAWNNPYQLAAFTDMELSTQLLVFDAIQQGIEVDIIDRHDQFLKLVLNDHEEYVKNGNMTSKDSYIASLIMENKTVTKKILHKQGFRVPQGEEFNDLANALRSYHQFSTMAFVVKPKSTNYGLGISIFREGATYEDYTQALTLAFKEDSSVLIEEFLYGTEYRFFVMNDKVQAVMARIPANVTGDGAKTIEELVAEKNKDPLRGRDHRTPLEKIQLGELEILMLKGQGKQPSSIPEKGEVLYLRENSNVSTGGDSIDVTDHIRDDYKNIAVKSVAALGAKISGLDLIIKDIEVPAANDNAYGIIEANFNPSMYMHIFPYKGKSRRLTMELLEYLFPELIKK
ncbi:bifunctional glutamate--cysteine ligase GshA/glutathione synthetase GshB [Planococcus versutus]|uniref:Glutathione biosynthesis bifunctional protein GshAB n=1 Tax=Planococcus versutus TaxID=1302659 RepID=A0A1B1S4U8_9BACL|nr:bifunctional glutamate--cysteine ligase GshA/glutathione synthetase GshB [Planococcus versutus]ANU28169.1 bifunctional glutamate--cysteine ligase/glutathione synthetase [Planococcus versutus]